MVRLNARAFAILQAEIRRCTPNDIAGEVQRNIALKRLEKLCIQPGPPLSLDEMRDTLIDLFPGFSESVLRSAAQANRPSVIVGRLKLATVLLASGVGLVGSIWVLNLPYPPIRWPVAKIAPILLLPSFISMDQNYRQAIALTEQADQLVNQATSAADLELGATKVKGAQKSLDALPVWFLGYYPQLYCSWFQCGWRFTLDEFQQARKEVARMDAKLFQETNAQTQLNQASQALDQARQQYQEAPSEAEKRAAIAQWQQAIDRLHQLPAQTLAERLAQPKLTAAERDFQQVSGLAADTAQSGNLIDAAKTFAQTAQQAAASSPTHTADEWIEIQKQWETAIARLNQIEVKDPDYPQAQKLLATYEQSAGTVRGRLKQEQDAVTAYETAQRLRNSLLASTPDQAKSLTNYQVSELQQIVDELKTVKQGTTVYADAQVMLKAAQARLK